MSERERIRMELWAAVWQSLFKTCAYEDASNTAEIALAAFDAKFPPDNTQPAPDASITPDLVEFVNRATLHLNRLATWAQQDPTGPTCAKGVQRWVLNEIRLALGQRGEPTPYVPLVFRQTPDAVLEAAERLADAMEHYRDSDDVHPQKILDALEHFRAAQKKAGGK